MFTGIIEQVGEIKSLSVNGSNHSFWISSQLAPELHVDQSLSHEGVCLTVEEIDTDTYKVTAIAETLSKTSLGNWQAGRLVNLERCLQVGARLDGHFVQGHVDGTGICQELTEKEGSWEYVISYPSEFAELIVEKGSICLNGISLTCFNVTRTTFTVAIIPYTYQHTSIRQLAIGDVVNLEFDILGKYILRQLSLK